MTGWYCNASIVKKGVKSTLDVNKVPVLKYFFDMAIRLEELKPGRSDIRVWTLQKYLVKL